MMVARRKEKRGFTEGRKVKKRGVGGKRKAAGKPERISEIRAVPGQYKRGGGKREEKIK